MGAIRDNAIALMRRHATQVSLDETLSPSLIKQAFINQQPQLFGDFVMAAFPTLYFHNRFRAVGRADFVTRIIENFGTHAFHDASVGCLSTVYLAHLTQDKALLRVSRHMYGVALRKVISALNTSEATGENMMSAMMMLSVYEMYARTTKDAWVMHANGIKRILQLRGVKAYESDFGRSCYVAFRGFLIATALYEGKPCLFEREEWQKFAAMVRQEDSKKRGEWSAFVDISELAFMEMAKCPRYISEAQSVTEATPQATIDNLMQRMRDTTKSLTGITTELTSCIAAHSQRQQGITYRPGTFVGPVPKVFPETSPSLLLSGAQCTIDTLGKLIDRLRDILEEKKRVEDVIVEPDPLSPSSIGSTSASGSVFSKLSPASSSAESCEAKTFSLPFRVVSELGRGPSNTSDKNDPRAVIWLDRVASSLGMLGTEIVHGDPEVALSRDAAVEEVYD